MPLKSFLFEKRLAKLKVGLVPTMGALHSGHLSLIRKCNSVCDLTVVSIFVNRAQFNNPEDFQKYPNTIQQDIALLQKEKVDVLFAPHESEIYSQASQLQFHFNGLDTIMEGEFRPGHFSGVCLIVAKLFNIINPATVFFGQKDLQQVAIIKKLNNELSFGINIQTVPTVRDADGLALSSRNKRLGEKERLLAPILYETMQSLRDQLLAGEDLETALVIARKNIVEKDASIKLEYLEVVDSKELTNVIDIELHEEISICVAAYFGDVRLIDNLFLFSR